MIYEVLILKSSNELLSISVVISFSNLFLGHWFFGDLAMVGVIKVIEYFAYSPVQINVIPIVLAG